LEFEAGGAWGAEGGASRAHHDEDGEDDDCADRYADVPDVVSPARPVASLDLVVIEGEFGAVHEAPLSFVISARGGYFVYPPRGGSGLGVGSGCAGGRNSCSVDGAILRGRRHREELVAICYPAPRQG